MAMMITKFHKLIQSKLIWICIAVVIVFSFVIWAMPGPARKDLAYEANKAGKLFDQKISLEEYGSARHKMYLSLAMMLGREPTSAEIERSRLSEQAWRRLASLKMARDLGISASNTEVVQAIKSQPLFQTENQYDNRLYQMFMYNFLSKLRVSERQFEEYIREEIMLQKLRAIVSQTLIITPYEIQRTFETVNDVFDIELVEITAEQVEDDVEVSEADIKAYFEENKELFMIPPKVRVRYVKLPVSDFMVEGAVSEEDALAYYDENIEDYTSVVEEEEEVVEEQDPEEAVDVLTADLDEESETVVIPFEEVKEEINDLLAVDAAKEKAAERATDLVLYLANAGASSSFDEAAAKFDLEVIKTDLFTMREQVEGVDAGVVFNEDCFQLLPNEDDYFSNAIMGKEYVYVTALDEQVDARLPELEEVRDELTEAARADALVDLMTETAETFHDAAVTGLDGDETFTQIAGNYDLDVVTMTNFSVLTGMEEDDSLSQILIPGILTYNQTEVTEPMPGARSLVVAHVISREPGTTASMSSLTPQIINAIKRERQPLIFSDFEEYLLVKGKHEDFLNVEVQETIEDVAEAPTSTDDV